MPGPHVDDEKGKKAMVYKARKDRRKDDGKKKRRNQISRAYPKRLLATLYARIFNLFTLKSNSLVQDQTSFLSYTL